MSDYRIVEEKSFCRILCMYCRETLKKQGDSRAHDRLLRRIVIHEWSEDEPEEHLEYCSEFPFVRWAHGGEILFRHRLERRIGKNRWELIHYLGNECYHEDTLKPWEHGEDPGCEECGE